MKKKPLMLLALALVALPLSSCGDDVVSDTGASEASESVKPVSSSTPAKEKFTIAFEADGKVVESLTVEEGDEVDSPSAPEKEGYRFLGWAFDEAGNRLADFPYSPSESTTLYAVYLSNLDYFLAAREKTLGGEGWRYKDELAIRTKLGAGSLSVDGPTGIRDGEVAHDEAGEGTHYAHYVTSGALFFDGESTSYRDGTSLLKVEQDEDGNITGATSAVAVPGVEDDGSTFAKAIFEYEEEDIHAILETEEEGVYEIDTKMNASSIIKSILGNLNNAVVEAIVGALPETVPDLAMYVTFTEDGHVDTYLYDFEVEVSVAGQPQTISLSYALDFTSYGKQAIAEPSFPGLYIERDEIAGFVAEEKEAMGKYLSSSGTSYDYELKTDVDFSALSLADSITVKGSTKREIKGGEVYFSNIVEVDQMGYLNEAAEEFPDYKRTRGKTADGKVWDVNDRIWPLSDEIVEVTGDTSLDEHYLLPSLLLEGAYVSLAIDGADGTAFHLTSTGVIALMDWIDDSVRLDETGAEKPSIWGEGNGYAALSADEALLTITREAGVMTAITVSVQGSYDAKIGENEGEADLSIDLSIALTADGEDYVAPEDAADLV